MRIDRRFPDLNYRVDIHDTEIRKIIGDKEWDNSLKVEALLRFDQASHYLFHARNIADTLIFE